MSNDPDKTPEDSAALPIPAPPMPASIDLGPNEFDRITYRSLRYQDRASAWTSPYWDNLRELALSHWIGSEYDIALLRIIPEDEDTDTTFRLYHVFNSNVNGAVRVLTGMAWDDLKCCHETTKALDVLELIACLLTYFNGVFLDDNLDCESRLYLPYPMPSPAGEEIIISRTAGTEEAYYRDDYWSAELERIYNVTLDEIDPS